MPDQERREFSRISVKVMTHIEARSESAFTGTASNLSMKGLYVSSEHLLPVGTTCQVVLQLSEDNKAPQIHANAEVVRQDKNGLGIEFKDVSVDSLPNLRELIQSHPKGRSKD